MRLARNMSAPGMLLPSISTNSASTHAARHGNPVPICPKAARQAKMRRWPHFSHTNRTKNLFSDTTMAASSYGLAAHLSRRPATNPRHANRSPAASSCSSSPQAPRIRHPRTAFTSTAQLQRKDNYTRNSSSSRYKNITLRYDRSRVPATEVPRPSSAPAMIQSTQSRVLVPSIDSTAQIDSPHNPLLDSPQRPSPHGASYHEAIKVEAPTLQEV